MTCIPAGAWAKEDVFNTEERSLIIVSGGTPVQGTFIQGKTGVQKFSLSTDCKCLKVTLQDNKCRLFDTQSLERIVTTNKKEQIYVVNDGYLLRNEDGMSLYSTDNHLVWSAKCGPVAWMNIEDDVVIAYSDGSNSTAKKGRVDAYSLTTGEKLWSNAFPQQNHRAWLHRYCHEDTMGLYS